MVCSIIGYARRQQILAVVAQIFLEEKEESDVVYVTWKQVWFIVDLLCCGAIIFPIVW